MPWKETTTVEQKVEFICEWLSEKYTITELSQAFGISRPTAYRMINNYEKHGIEGLLERPFPERISNYKYPGNMKVMLVTNN